MTRGEYDVNNDNRVESADYQEHQLKQRKNGDVLHDDTNKVESIEIPSKEKPYVGYGFKEVITAKNLYPLLFAHILQAFLIMIYVLN